MGRSEKGNVPELNALMDERDKRAKLQEKNRRAQQAFRWRQKSKIQELTDQVTALENKEAAHQAEIEQLQRSRASLKRALGEQAAQLLRVGTEYAVLRARSVSNLFAPAHTLRFDPSEEIVLKYPATASGGSAEHVLLPNGTGEGGGAEEVARHWRDHWLPELRRLEEEHKVQTARLENAGAGSKRTKQILVEEVQSALVEVEQQAAATRDVFIGCLVKLLRSQPLRARMVATNVLHDPHASLDCAGSAELAERVVADIGLSDEEAEATAEAYGKFLCDSAVLRLQRAKMTEQLRTAYIVDDEAWLQACRSSTEAARTYLGVAAALETFGKWLHKETELYCGLLTKVVLDSWRPGTFMRCAILCAPGLINFLTIFNAIRARTRCGDDVLAETKAFVDASLAFDSNAAANVASLAFDMNPASNAAAGHVTPSGARREREGNAHGHEPCQKRPRLPEGSILEGGLDRDAAAALIAAACMEAKAPCSSSTTPPATPPNGAFAHATPQARPAGGSAHAPHSLSPANGWVPTPGGLSACGRDTGGPDGAGGLGWAGAAQSLPTVQSGAKLAKTEGLEHLGLLAAEHASRHALAGSGANGSAALAADIRHVHPPTVPLLPLHNVRRTDAPTAPPASPGEVFGNGVADLCWLASVRTGSDNQLCDFLAGILSTDRRAPSGPATGRLGPALGAPDAGRRRSASQAPLESPERSNHVDAPGAAYAQGNAGQSSAASSMPPATLAKTSSSMFLSQSLSAPGAGGPSAFQSSSHAVKAEGPGSMTRQSPAELARQYHDFMGEPI